MTISPPSSPAEPSSEDLGRPAPPSFSSGASVSLRVLALLAVLYTVYFARPFLLPVLTAVMLRFLLSPIVRALQRLRLPAAPAAALVVLGFSGLAGYGIYRLSGPALEWTRELPDTLRRSREKIEQLKGPVEDVTASARRVEEEIAELGGEQIEPVAVRTGPSTRERFLSGTGAVVGNVVVVLVLLYFLLTQTETLFSKVARRRSGSGRWGLDGELVHDLERRVSRYLLTITAINLGLGTAIALHLLALGMPNPFLWGAMAAALNFVPYLGAVVGVVVVGVVGLAHFDQVGYALLAPGGYAVLTALEGMVVTPSILGRDLRISPALLFVWLLLWSWMWGVAGALLAVPMLVVLRIASEHVGPLKPLARALGR